MVEPTIEFCRIPDGSRVAYASVGEGPPLVLVPGWLSHVGQLWSHPAAASALEKLAADHRVIWYDRIGGGLSDRSRPTSSMSDDLAQLEAVLEAAGVERCRLVGYSAGGPVAVTFSAASPRRVEHLVLYSTYACGQKLSSQASHDSLIGLVTGNWKLATLAMGTIFIPNGSSTDLSWFSRFQREASAPQTAAAFLTYMRSHDVGSELARLRVPTTVITNSHDPAVAPEHSRELARLVPGARLVVLDGNEHDPFIRDSGNVVEAILAAVEGRPFVRARPPATIRALTPRESEVLTLLANGSSNKEIAGELGIRTATVERHLTHLYEKLEANGRADAAAQAVTRGLVALPSR